MMRFEYHRPADLSEALDFIAARGGDCAPLAGGTDLLVMIQERLISPGVLLDLGGLEELKGIEESGGRIRIGALVSHRQAADSDLLAEKGPPLPASCREVGSPQIRTLGTIGGNLAMASPSGDTIPALFALSAAVVLQSRAGTRTMPIEDFFTGVKKSVRRPDELLTEITFPIPASPVRGFFKKLGQRKALAISKVSVAALVTLEAQKVGAIRIALGAVAPTVIRASRTEEYLTGRELNRETIASARTLCSEESQAITDLRSTARYRDRMTGLLLARGLAELI